MKLNSKFKIPRNRKQLRDRRNPQYKCATILIITMWIITLLSAIAFSLTYRMGMGVKMAEGEINREKVFCITKAGIIQALAVLNQDTNEYDALSEQWSNSGLEIYNVNLLKDIGVGEGRFTVSYIYENEILGTQQIFYGMEDEERKININKATQDVLESIPGFNPEIAGSIRAWRGDTDVAPDITFKEDAYYQGLKKPYKRKGKPFECLEELLLVRGITPELIYGKDLNGNGIIDTNERTLVKYLTVYGDGLININTASAVVLTAILQREDLSYKIVEYRLGEDNQLGTSDDGIFRDTASIIDCLNNSFNPLIPDEEELIKQKQDKFKVKSRYFTARCEGSISEKTKYIVSAILDKESAEGSQITRWDE